MKLRNSCQDYTQLIIIIVYVCCRNIKKIQFVDILGINFQNGDMI